MTGAAHGVGFSIAERLGREGGPVAAIDVRARRLGPAVEDLRARDLPVRGYAVDVGDRAAARSVFERFDAEIGAPVAALGSDGGAGNGATRRRRDRQSRLGVRVPSGPEPDLAPGVNEALAATGAMAET